MIIDLEIILLSISVYLKTKTTTHFARLSVNMQPTTYLLPWLDCAIFEWSQRKRNINIRIHIILNLVKASIKACQGNNMLTWHTQPNIYNYRDKWLKRYNVTLKILQEVEFDCLNSSTFLQIFETKRKYATLKVN